MQKKLSRNEGEECGGDPPIGASTAPM